MKPFYFLSILTFMPVLGSAQTPPVASSGSTESPTSPPPRVQAHHHLSAERQLAWLTIKLDLSDAQQKKIKPVLVEKAEHLKVIEENAALTKEQMHEQTKALLESTNQKIESFLIPAQVEAFEQLHHNKWAQ